MTTMIDYHCFHVPIASNYTWVIPANWEKLKFSTEATEMEYLSFLIHHNADMNRNNHVSLWFKWIINMYSYVFYVTNVKSGSTLNLYKYVLTFWSGKWSPHLAIVYPPVTLYVIHIMLNVIAIHTIIGQIDSMFLSVINVFIGILGLISRLWKLVIILSIYC